MTPAARLAGKKIAILVAEGVEDLEFYVPLMRLQEEGAEVISAGTDIKPVRGKHGLEITPQVRVDSLVADELFGLVVPGGWAPDKYLAMSRSPWPNATATAASDAAAHAG